MLIAFFYVSFYFQVNIYIIFMKVIALHKDLKNLRINKCTEISQNALEFAVLDCLYNSTPEEVIVGLASSILNFNDQYCKSSENSIKILKCVIAQLEQDNEILKGNKLN